MKIQVSQIDTMGQPKITVTASLRKLGRGAKSSASSSSTSLGHSRSTSSASSSEVCQVGLDFRVSHIVRDALAHGPGFGTIADSTLCECFGKAPCGKPPKSVLRRYDGMNSRSVLCASRSTYAHSGEEEQMDDSRAKFIDSQSDSLTHSTSSAVMKAPVNSGTKGIAEAFDISSHTAFGITAMICLAVFVLCDPAFFGFYMAWNIVATDVATAMGTSVRSGALILRQEVMAAPVVCSSELCEDCPSP